MFKNKFNYSKSPLLLFFLLFTITSTIAQPTPPNGKEWQLIDMMSDEFNGTDLNGSKWAKSDPQWRGRVPGLFKENTIAVNDGKLKVTNYKLSSPEGDYTHACGMVRGLQRNTYGYYETRMKASRTFMSSTFWLFNKRNEFSGCDVRTTELDITETVGVNSNGATWVDNTIRQINSNTHSRATTCNDTPIGQEGNNAQLGGKSWEAYHTYGVWWKSKDEILFYLDGQFVYEITPPADFNLPMYLRLVTETYDWNPTPSDGGMNGSADSRTTYYDWVRSYNLVDSDMNTVDTVSFNNMITELEQQASYTFDVTYEASTDREIVVELWSSTNWLQQGKIVVPQGSGTATITVNLDAIPQPGQGYALKTHIRPLGTTWEDALNRDQINNITINGTLSNDSFDTLTFNIHPNPSCGVFNIKLNQDNNILSDITVYTISGKKVYENTLKTNTINLSNLASGLYLMKITKNGKVATRKISIKK